MVVLRCRVNNQALVPGTAFFEFATAAAAALCSNAQPGMVPCLTHASISAPKVLHANTSDPQAAVENMLECKIDWEQAGAAAGVSMLTVRSASKAGVHLRCGAAMLQAPGSILRAANSVSKTARACRGQPTPAVLRHLTESCRSQRAILAGVAQPKDCAGVGSHSGFVVHPAAADASLHLGAVPGSSTGSHAALAPRPSRVPVALGAYTASLGATGTGNFTHSQPASKLAFGQCAN